MSNQVHWGNPPARLVLGSEDVHVWSAQLNGLKNVEADFRSLLSREEINRASRFKFAEHRAQFVLTRGVLRRVLAGYLCRSPNSIEIAEDEKKKPFVRLGDPGAPAWIRFNTSHSDSLAVFAFSRGLTLGIDIENVQREIDFQAIVESHFTESEKAAFRVIPPPSRRQAFFEAWTRKEAYLKALGDGLRAPLNSIEIPLGSIGEPILLKNSGLQSFVVYSFVPGARATGALAVEGERHNLQFLRWEWGFAPRQ